MNEKISKPYMNCLCDLCKWSYLLDDDEMRCKKIKLGSSHVMCAQVLVCATYEQKEVINK